MRRIVGRERHFREGEEKFRRFIWTNTIDVTDLERDRRMGIGVP